MMNKTSIAAALMGAALLLNAGSASAIVGATDNVPAATLLLPYFEIDTQNPGGIRTVVTVGNRSTSEQLAHVTLWTDRGVPTYTFDVRLPASGVKEIDLGALFTSGTVPSSTAGGFASCAASLPKPNLNAGDLAGLRNAHTGLSSSLLGNQCGGAVLGDGRARGYITIDSVSACSTAKPGDVGYFVFGGLGIANNNNVLWGEYATSIPSQNMGWGDTLVHIEASATAIPTNGVPDPPSPGAPMVTLPDYTFYGRLVGANAADNREALSQQWHAAYSFQDPFNDTNTVVWRDPGAVTPFACGSPPADISTAEVLIFDNQEEATVSASPISPLPYATQSFSLQDPTKIAVPFDNGMLSYSLGLKVPAGPFGSRNQAFVSHRYTSLFGSAGEAKASGFLPILQGGFILNQSGAASPPQCSDGIDNDNDNLVDFPADPDCRTANQSPETSQCSDGVDNDGDMLTDFPADPDCFGPRDLREDQIRACDDGIDNDLDGLVDWPADNGCSNPNDNSENIGACDDGIDNDSDGFIDFPADTGCQSRTSSTEAPVCRDGIDNDTDGFVDFPADTGCETPFSGTEAPVCRNGIDDDMDGLIDFPLDPGCETAFSFNESPSCNDGFDNDGDMLIDFPADPGCAAPFSGFNERPQCNNGFDDDGNGLIDFPADFLGCSSASENLELSEQCKDGIDNNGDGLFDFPNDPACSSLNDPREVAECDDGVDNDLDGLMDFPADPGCASLLDVNELASSTVRQCNDGIDNDNSGLIDFPADPGCTSENDDVEYRSPGAPVLVLAPASLPGGFVNVAYSAQLTASGGVGPYTITLDSGSLPTPLTLSAGGLISGTPNAVGSFNFVIRIVDSKGFSSTQMFNIVISDPSADLVLNFSASSLLAQINAPVTFTATALNQGPAPAANVVARINLSADFRYSSHTATGATCTSPQVGLSGSIICTWPGDTAVGVTRSLQVVARSNVEGTSNISANTSSDAPDLVPGNNSANLNVTVSDLVEAIPTLNGLGLLILGLMVGLIGFATARRSN